MRLKLGLTDRQQEQVIAAAATLRLKSQDRFLQDLAHELGRRRYPPTDTDVKVAIRQLLGITPLRNFAGGHDDAA